MQDPANAEPPGRRELPQGTPQRPYAEHGHGREAATDSSSQKLPCQGHPGRVDAAGAVAVGESASAGSARAVSCGLSSL
jgi:hypothetical protein